MKRFGVRGLDGRDPPGGDSGTLADQRHPSARMREHVAPEVSRGAADRVNDALWGDG